MLSKNIHLSEVFVLSYRIRVTVNGEFLHYIYPFQFLDSPEWDSLRPSEEGVFQVTSHSLTHAKSYKLRLSRNVITATLYSGLEIWLVPIFQVAISLQSVTVYFPVFRSPCQLITHVHTCHGGGRSSIFFLLNTATLPGSLPWLCGMTLQRSCTHWTTAHSTAPDIAMIFAYQVTVTCRGPN